MSSTFLTHIFRRGYCTTKYKYRGIEVLRNPRTNRGTAFTLRERQLLGIQGLLPPVELDVRNQLARIMHNLQHSCENDLNRFNLLTGLQDRNEQLFYKLVAENVQYCMPLIYTPTVGQACLKYGQVFRRPRGIFLTVHDRGHIADVLDNWPESQVRCVVASDGSSVLGLGDLGANGMGSAAGKMNVITALGKVPPQYCLPVMLDAGVNNAELMADPLYIGLRQRRVSTDQYDEFLDEFMRTISAKYGANTMVQFENLTSTNALRLLQRYRQQNTVLNDEVQSFAAVNLAGLMTAAKHLQPRDDSIAGEGGRVAPGRLRDNKFLFVGAGQVAIGLADLLVRAMCDEARVDREDLEQHHTDGASQEAPQFNEEDARARIIMMDSSGVLNVDRLRSPQFVSTHPHKLAYCHANTTHASSSASSSACSLEEVIDQVRPTVLIGASGQPQLFSRSVFDRLMAVNEKGQTEQETQTTPRRPIVVCLSYPITRAEVSAEEASQFSNGKCIFWRSCSHTSRHSSTTDEAGSSIAYNAYSFPGLSLAVTTAQIRPITDDLLIAAAKSISGMMTQEELAKGLVLPEISRVHDINFNVAAACVNAAYKQGLTLHFPEPEDKEKFLRDNMYSLDYSQSVEIPYSWPPGVVNRQ